MFQKFRFLSSVVHSSVDLVGSFGTKYDPSAPLSPAITTNSTKICTTNFTSKLFVRKISLGKTYSTVLVPQNFVQKESIFQKRLLKMQSPQSWYVLGWVRGRRTVYMCAADCIGERNGGLALTGNWRVFRNMC